MPSSKKEKVILTSMGLVGLGMILWWCCVEYLWLVPKAGKRSPRAEDIFRELMLTPWSARVKTGDLLFFRGLSWMEKSIQTYTQSRYNHVSMIIRADDLFLWEADVGEDYHQGPRIIPLQKKLLKWKGTSEVAWRSCYTKASKKKILDFVREVLGLPFDRSMLVWAFPWWPRDQRVYFCSELIAETLMKLRVLEKGKRASGYSPGDLAFGEIGGRYKDLEVIKG